MKQKMNRRGFIEEFNFMAATLGVVAGLIGLVIAAKMQGGWFIRPMAFLICAIAGYFIGAKMSDN